MRLSYLQKTLLSLMKNTSYKLTGIAVGTKMAVAFSDGYFYGRPCIETRLLAASPLKPSVIDSLTTYFLCGTFQWGKFSFFLLTRSTLRSNVLAKCHPIVLFFSTERCSKDLASARLDSQTHFKPTETFRYTHFSSCHPIRKRVSEVASGHVTLGTNVNISKREA